MKTYKEITQCELGADTLAEAIINLVEADKNLKLAKENIPNETGQWNPKDYYAEEQELWNMWANLVYDKVRFATNKYNPSVVTYSDVDSQPYNKNKKTTCCPNCGEPDISTIRSPIAEYVCGSKEHKYKENTFEKKCLTTRQHIETKFFRRNP